MLFNFDLSTVYAKRASNNRPQGVNEHVEIQKLERSTLTHWVERLLCSEQLAPGSYQIEVTSKQLKPKQVLTCSIRSI